MFERKNKNLRKAFRRTDGELLWSVDVCVGLILKLRNFIICTT